MIIPTYNNNVIYHCYVEVAMQENTSDTLNKIQKAALKEFLDNGFLGASLRQIVKDAGVTTGAFYGYFSSKEIETFKKSENYITKLEERLEENEASIKNRKKSFQIDSLELNSSVVEPTVSLDAKEKERE